MLLNVRSLIRQRALEGFGAAVVLGCRLGVHSVGVGGGCNAGVGVKGTTATGRKLTRNTRSA